MIDKHETDIQSSPWSVDDPSSGKRKVITDPWDPKASKFTWHSDGQRNYTTTQGNNGIAVQDYSGESTNKYQPTSPELKFEYRLPLNDSDPNAYRDASLTQLFYTANFYHDLLYELGFNENAGNFQANNNGKGGKDGDPVILSAQDSYGTDNAVVSNSYSLSFPWPFRCFPEIMPPFIRHTFTTDASPLLETLARRAQNDGN